MIDAKWTGVVLTVVGMAVGSVVYIHKTFATVGEFQVAATQAQYSIDLHIQGIMAQIARLEAKSNKSADERAQLEYLRGELVRLRELRKVR